MPRIVCKIFLLLSTSLIMIQVSENTLLCSKKKVPSKKAPPTKLKSTTVKLFNVTFRPKPKMLNCIYEKMTNSELLRGLLNVYLY